MIEKKTAAIAILCVATVLFLGLWANSAQEARTLNSKYVKAIEDYNRLNSDYDQMVLESREFKREKAALLGRIEQMNATYEELLAKYNYLLAAHNMASDPNDPNNRVTTLKDLIIKFTVYRTVYNYTDDIRGEVKIYYMDGTPFRGGFQIEVEGTSTGSIGPWLQIAGMTIWERQYPVFRDGPGTYKIYMVQLTTWNGYNIQDGAIEDTVIQLEAK